LKIADNVHLIPWVFGHAYILTEADGMTLIDTGFPYSAAWILSYITWLGRQPEDLKRIIVTHADIDHAGCLGPLRSATGARLATSPVEAEAIGRGETSRRVGGAGRLRGVIGIAASVVKAAPARVDELLADGDEMPILGGLRVINTPGHTPGHISLWSPSRKILFPGDSFAIRFNHFKPYQGWNVWDMEESIASFRRQADLRAELVCGGHRCTRHNIDGKFRRGAELFKIGEVLK
jgi:glyoxylase-like metal-dependent hydrolase (beta-lactamase superfamily II)